MSAPDPGGATWFDVPPDAIAGDPSPDEPAWDGLDVLRPLEAEVFAAAAADPEAELELRRLEPDERSRLVDLAEVTRRNHDAQVGALGPATRAAHQLACPLCIARALPVAPPAGPTWRTLADVPDDPPGPLLFGMLEAPGQTLLVAAPGVGKGMTGAHLCCEAQAAGMLPAVYDAERRPREWSRRVGGLGGDRSRVVYIEPADLPPAVRGRPLWDVAPAIGEVLRAAGADVLVVDSIMPAVGLAEDRLKSDAQVPFLYVAALDALGLPVASFGHPPKGQPEGEPFGSFAWVAAHRLTWLGTRAESDEHRIRWRPRKRNERGHVPGILLTVTYGEDGRPCAIAREDDEESTRDWILAALVRGPRSVADLAEELVDELEAPAIGEIDRTKERLGRALRRMAREGWVDKLGQRGRGVTWSLRLRDERP